MYRITQYFVEHKCHQNEAKYTLYTTKHSRGKTFIVGIENDHSWENVHGSSFFQ